MPAAPAVSDCAAASTTAGDRAPTTHTTVGHVNITVAEPKRRPSITAACIGGGRGGVECRASDSGRWVWIAIARCRQTE
eukprot:20000-Eustigmatos_ZCMA.PRE.1